MKPWCKLNTSVLLPPNFETHSNVVPVVILHALFGTSNSFRFLASQKKISKPLILVDLRNHGKSEISKSMTYDDMSHDLLKVAEKLKLKKFSLLGHSMGGKVAMNICLKHPELVDKTAIMDISPVSYFTRQDWDIPTVIASMKYLNLNSIKNRKEVIKILQEKFKFELRMCYFILSNLEQLNENQWKWKFNLDGIEKNTKEIAGFPENNLEYKKNILFLRGENSFRVSEEYYPILKKKFPKCEIETMKNAGQ
eukprot:gene5328-9137_t